MTELEGVKCQVLGSVAYAALAVTRHKSVCDLLTKIILPLLCI